MAWSSASTWPRAGVGENLRGHYYPVDRLWFLCGKLEAAYMEGLGSQWCPRQGLLTSLMRRARLVGRAQPGCRFAHEVFRVQCEILSASDVENRKVELGLVDVGHQVAAGKASQADQGANRCPAGS